MITTVLVHKGVEYFPHISDCIDQFFLFNMNERLVLVTDGAFSQVGDLAKRYPGLQNIRSGDLKKSREHIFFSRWNRMRKSTWRGGFWRFAVERFFVLQDYMSAFGVEQVLHFEYDNLVYFRIGDLEDKFLATSKGISVPIDSMKRCIPSIVFIRDLAAISDFCRNYNWLYLIRNLNDMRAFFLYSRRRSRVCSYLPVVPSSYRDGKKELRSLTGATTKKFDLFDGDFEVFKGIFDAAAVGQFLGGVDPRNDPPAGPGFVNETAMYSPLDFSFGWEKDGLGRLLPVCTHAGQKFPIFNLHIHSKALHEFRSDRSKRTIR